MSVHQRGSLCILKISAAQLNMAGIYECEVYKDKTTCQVTVEGRHFIEIVIGPHAIN